jgi:RNA polymerase sigma factor (sigma-70 family)
MDVFSNLTASPSAAGGASTHMPFVHDNRWQPHYLKAHVSQNRIATVSALGGLEAVLEANRPALGSFLRARLRGDDGAEDILQELWIKARSIDAGPIAEPLAYLYRMAENLVLDRRRAGGRRNAREQEWTSSQIEGTLEAPADAAPNAERILIARDMLRRVDARLDALPERTAFVFRSVRVEGRPQKELAAELAISLSAVEKHLQRAYQEIVAVHDELNADCDGSRRLLSNGATNDK